MDTPLELNCPKCPRRLRFMRVDDAGLPYYVCVEHGWLVIGKDGRLRPVPGPPERKH